MARFLFAARRVPVVLFGGFLLLSASVTGKLTALFMPRIIASGYLSLLGETTDVTLLVGFVLVFVFAPELMFRPSKTG
jgi:hypothetical protein